MRDIKAGKIPGVVSLPEYDGVASKCLGYFPKGQKKVPRGNIIHIFQEGVPGVIKGDPDKIACFSRFGSNFTGEKAINKIAAHYKLGYYSSDDGTKRLVPRKHREGS
jgi:hypothetical protein